MFRKKGSVLLYIAFGALWMGIWLWPYGVIWLRSPFRLGRPAPVTVIAPIRLQRPSVPRTALHADTTHALDLYQELAQSLDYITLLRQAEYLTWEEKIQELRLLQTLAVTEEEAELWLSQPEAQWRQVYKLTLQVAARLLQYPDIPVDTDKLYQLIVPWLPENTSPDIAFLVVRLLNAYFRRIAPQTQTDTIYEPGQVIVARGETVDAARYVVLQRLGLIHVDIVALGSHTLLMALWMALLASYLRQRAWPPRPFLLTAALFLGFAGYVRGSLLLYRVPTWILVALPIPVIGLPALFLAQDLMAGFLWTLSLSITLFMDLPRIPGFILYYAIVSLALLLSLHRFRGLREYLYTALSTAVFALLGSPSLSYATGMELNFWFKISPVLVLYAFLMAGLALFAEYSLGLLTGQVTHLHLMDLARPDHPLLRELMRRAPGTYQHSLMVASLAEQAARAIQADAFLCRVGGLYHDVGKLYNPAVFVENQSADTTNPLTLVDPYTAAHLIKEHVSKGLEYAAQYRLPRRIRDFIAEHHGTTVVFMPYKRAIEAAGGDASRVPLEAFSYPGPKPRSKETAILMLADICEARVRAASPDSVEEIRRLVRDSIELRFREGELDNSGLSIAELRKIEDAFVHVLVGIYHRRIRYEAKEDQGPVRYIPAKQRGRVPAASPTKRKRA